MMITLREVEERNTDTIYSVDYSYEVDKSDQGQKNIVLE